MKRVFLAVLLASPAAFARAEDAFVSLAGMALVAATDKGPEAGEIPKDAPAPAPEKAAAAVEGAPAADAPVRPVRRAEKKTAEARKAEREAREGLIVAADVSAGPRVWTRFFSSLAPSPRSGSFELAVSTEVVRSTSPATVAGVSSGLAEVVAAFSAPSLNER